MKRYVAAVAVLAMLLVMVQGQSKQADCKKWGKLLFFEKASPSRVRECLAQGASLSDFREGFTPLHAAVFGRTPYPEVIDILIRAGADVSAHSQKSTRESTPLHRAVLVALWNPERMWAVRMLLESGADVNARNMFGKTPLHHAVGVRAKRDTSDLAQVLIEAGADVNAITDKGESAMNMTKEPRVRRVLATAGGRNAPKKPKTKSGLGALAAGLFGAVAATGAGLNEDEALAVGQDAADTVLTGTPTVNATSAAVDRTRAREEAVLRDAALAEATATATARAVSDELVNQRLLELGLDPHQFDDQHTIRQKLRERDEARLKAEPLRIRNHNTRILNSGCKCIRIKDNGEYGCLDGLVAGNNRLCDIAR